MTTPDHVNTFWRFNGRQNIFLLKTIFSFRNTHSHYLLISPPSHCNSTPSEKLIKNMAIVILRYNQKLPHALNIEYFKGNKRTLLNYDFFMVNAISLSIISNKIEEEKKEEK